MMGKKKKLFCEISPLTYAISLKKEILKRHVRNSLSREVFAKTKQREKLPVLIYSHGNNMIKMGPGIDPRLQVNKADNIRLACSRMAESLCPASEEACATWRIRSICWSCTAP
ncbi:MAG: hypothetical protein IJP73_04890 [Bacteroidales bacterium]|nr:hypothetical protein [Bacteroidales bacterium]